jgi:hypothetical protein
MIAGMVLSNLLYVVGAIVAATVVSGIVLLRHRRPKSLEAGIEMFSRELKALEPDRRGPGTSGPGRVVPTGANRDGGASGGRTQVPGRRTGGSARPGGPVRPFRSTGAVRGAASAVTPAAPLPADGLGGLDSQTGRDEAGAPSPDRENEPG